MHFLKGERQKKVYEIELLLSGANLLTFAPLKYNNRRFHNWTKIPKKLMH